MKSEIERLVFSWLLTWAWCYGVAAFIAPEISGMSPAYVGSLVYFGVAMWLAIALLLWDIGESHVHRRMRNIADVLLILLATVEVVSGVGSWTGAAVWLVPFPDKGIFQVSMALADLISAAGMFYLGSIVTE